MKKHIQKKRLTGFNLIELMVVIAIIAILATMATPAAFYQQTRSINYANLALQHAKSYVNMINDQYTQWYASAQSAGSSTIISIPYSTVISNGYDGATSQIDIYGATPCATIRYNSNTKKLEMYMYYSGGTGVQTSVISSASNYLNGIAGILVSNGNYNGAFETWSIASSNITSSACGTPATGDMAINLNLLTTQVSQMKGDVSLHRTLDTSGSATGSSANTNTMQTDIIMGYKLTPASNTIYNGIFLTESNNVTTKPYITSGANTRLVSPYNTGFESDIVIANANVVANSFIPKSSFAPGTACASTQVGKIVLDSTAQSGTGVVVSTLTCTYDGLNCTTSPYYCYLPSNRVSITYTPAANSTSYTCPTGYYVDTSVPIVLTKGPLPSNPNNCTVYEAGPRVAIPAGAIITNNGNSIYTGVSAAASSTSGTKWMISQSSTQNGCTSGSLLNAAAYILRVTCTNYPTVLN